MRDTTGRCHVDLPEAGTRPLGALCFKARLEIPPGGITGAARIRWLRPGVLASGGLLLTPVLVALAPPPIPLHPLHAPPWLGVCLLAPGSLAIFALGILAMRKALQRLNETPATRSTLLCAVTAALGFLNLCSALILAAFVCAQLGRAS